MEECEAEADKLGIVNVEAETRNMGNKAKYRTGLQWSKPELMDRKSTKWDSESEKLGLVFTCQVSYCPGMSYVLPFVFPLFCMPPN